jgi:large subunit ribosomal protein L35
MFSLSRRLTPRSLAFVRANSTLQPANASSTSIPPSVLAAQSTALETDAAAAPTNSPTGGGASAESSTTTQGRRRRKGPRPPTVHRRPDISVEKSRTWNRPLKPGVLPAYDLALELILEDSARLKKEAEQVRSDIAKLDASDGSSEGKLQELKKLLHVLEVQSEVNVPEVRWNVANAMVDMTKPAHRHLVEQSWRKDGDLDLLMERIHQMHVVPDVLPDLHPSLDLRITAPATSAQFFADPKKRFVEVEPGVYLTPDRVSLASLFFHRDYSPHHVSLSHRLEVLLNYMRTCSIRKRGSIRC